jgi:hypothetical protein
METPPAASATKRCPECTVHIPIDATRCTDCGKRVGPVDKSGVARRATNYRAYAEMIIAFVVFGLFVWWFFFKDK